LPGNPKLKPLLPLYCKNVQALFLTYAVNDLDSFTEVANWERLFDDAAPNAPVKKYLIGLKNDLPFDQRTVTWEMGNDFATSCGYTFHECAPSKNYGADVNRIMNDIGNDLERRLKDKKDKV
jgi:GTPase SAR1 family protein